MTTRAIRTTDAATTCDVCGRTLLRGERAEIYLDGGARRSVCELCISRAVHEGWMREGAMPTYDPGDTDSERHRPLLPPLLSRFRGQRNTPLLGRFRGWRKSRATSVRNEFVPHEPVTNEPVTNQPVTDEPLSNEPVTDEPLTNEPALEAHEVEGWQEPPAAPPPPRARVPPRATSRAPFREPVRVPAPVREPRRVHAIPMSVEHKISSALEVFNCSEHRRTVAGVSRSLGLPTVSVQPSVARASVVGVVVSWELCWYRYEVDLSDDQPRVRLADQGYELDELSATERTPNATADEAGSLAP